jgi:hypothetical protein
MAKGAIESGDDMVVGRLNWSDMRTRLVATNGDPDGYGADFVLHVSIANDKVLVQNPNGVDAIHATGTVEFPTGGAIGVIPAGNGVVGRGLNGLVGYVHPAPRDTSAEREGPAGVIGVGAAATPAATPPYLGSVGVFGRGVNGVVGYEQSTPRDLVSRLFEANEKAGVFGRGEIGVSGDGVNGPGVHGRGSPGNAGVSGESTTGSGVLGEGATGVYATGSTGPGVHAISKTKQAALLESTGIAQLLLLPLRIKDPTSLLRSTAGELLATVWMDEVPADAPPDVPRGIERTSLWFCKIGGDPTQANWVKLA